MSTEPFVLFYLHQSVPPNQYLDTKDASRFIAPILDEYIPLAMRRKAEKETEKEKLSTNY